MDLILVSPIIGTALSAISLGLPNRFVLLMTVYTLLLWIYQSIRNRNMPLMLVIVAYLLFLYSYSINISGLAILENLDFYGFIHLVLVLLLFSDLDFCEALRKKIIKISFPLMIIFFLFFCINWTKQIISFRTISNFQGFFEFPHIFAYYSLISYSTAMIISRTRREIKNRTCSIVLKFIAISSVLCSSVRSATLVLALLIISDFISIHSISIGIKGLIVAALSFIAIFVLSNPFIIEKIPVINKTIIASESGSITNGRERFAEYALEYFRGLTLKQKFFGTGIQSIRDVMYRKLGTPIHAHNDFINVMVGYGILSLFIVVVLIFIFSHNTKSFILPISLVILMYYNGLYMYALFVVCLPILKASLLSCKRKNND